MLLLYQCQFLSHEIHSRNFPLSLVQNTTLFYQIAIPYCLNVLIYRFEKNIIEKVRMPGTTLFEVRSITLLIDNEEFMHDILIVFP